MPAIKLNIQVKHASHPLAFGILLYSRFQNASTLLYKRTAINVYKQYMSLAIIEQGQTHSKYKKYD